MCHTIRKNVRNTNRLAINTDTNISIHTPTPLFFSSKLTTRQTLQCTNHIKIQYINTLRSIMFILKNMLIHKTNDFAEVFKNLAT